MKFFLTTKIDLNAYLLYLWTHYYVLIIKIKMYYDPVPAGVTTTTYVEEAPAYGLGGFGGTGCPVCIPIPICCPCLPCCCLTGVYIW
jgi:hypothetical protein